jgi:hypothetical protein
MLADFRKRNATPPPEVMTDLKSAKTLIKILSADPKCQDAAQKIDVYLGNVESYLVSEGQKRFGTDYVDDWLKRLNEASQKITDKEEDKTDFVSGLPRDQRWIRVEPTAGLPADKVKELAQESNLLFKVENDGRLIIYGKDDQIKDFVKKMATKYESKAQK